MDGSMDGKIDRYQCLDPIFMDPETKEEKGGADVLPAWQRNFFFRFGQTCSTTSY